VGQVSRATHSKSIRAPAKHARLPAARAATSRVATRAATPGKKPLTPANPWRALWAMMVGFFMILVDSTIVAVANPVIKDKLNADYSAVIWVTSAYLLAYAVPLLVAGRLGDRFGPKNLYLLGLAIFTGSSLWCGLSGTIDMLIVARVAQGIGAALLTPQTLTMITRIFPPERRGPAMSLWGATAGVASLVGPLAGGVLVDGLGWQWIFFVNVPVGVVGLGLAVWLIPPLSTREQRLDLLGVLFSGVGMFLIVFGLQEGQSHNWAPWIWGTIAGGVGFMAAFVFWQSMDRHEPLIPLHIFRDRNFSLSNVGIAVIGFAVTAMVLPLMFYAQAVCGLSPTRSALLIAPMAIATGVLAPVVGRIVDRSHPRPVIGSGFSVLAAALTWLAIEMTPTTPIWRLLLPLAAMGVGMAFIWTPLAVAATRNLPAELAGAGSGVYNAIRQVGAVLGSASIAAYMTWRISAALPPTLDGGPGSAEGSVTRLPGFLHMPFAAAMSQSVLLPAFVSLFGVVAALFLLGSPNRSAEQSGARAQPDSNDVRTDPIPAARLQPNYAVDDYEPEYFDDDDYLEYTLSAGDAHRAYHDDYAEYHDDDAEYGGEAHVDNDGTEPMRTPAAPPSNGFPRPAQRPGRDPVEGWHFDPLDPAPREPVEPIGFAHNGFHTDREQRFRDLHELTRREQHEPEPRRRDYDADAETYGRHSMRTRD
jgi:EmrB/QacA subfamily drug resistance transporter